MNLIDDSNNNDKDDFTVLTRFSYPNNQKKYYQFNNKLVKNKILAFSFNIKQDAQILLPSVYGLIEKVDVEDTEEGEPLIKLTNLSFRFFDANEEGTIFHGVYSANHLKQFILPQIMVVYSNSLLSKEKRDASFPKFYAHEHLSVDKQIKIECLPKNAKVKIILYIFYKNDNNKLLNTKNKKKTKK